MGMEAIDLQDAIDDLQTEIATLEERIAELEGKEAILYPLARLMRNTDGIHPSTYGPAAGSLLLQLRLLDGSKYAMEVM